jgi:hypothetical protein
MDKMSKSSTRGIGRGAYATAIPPRAAWHFLALYDTKNWIAKLLIEKWWKANGYIAKSFRKPWTLPAFK